MYFLKDLLLFTQKNIWGEVNEDFMLRNFFKIYNDKYPHFFKKNFVLAHQEFEKVVESRYPLKYSSAIKRLCVMGKKISQNFF